MNAQEALAKIEEIVPKYKAELETIVPDLEPVPRYREEQERRQSALEDRLMNAEMAKTVILGDLKQMAPLIALVDTMLRFKAELESRLVPLLQQQKTEEDRKAISALKYAIAVLVNGAHNYGPRCKVSQNKVLRAMFINERIDPDDVDNLEFIAGADIVIREGFAASSIRHEGKIEYHQRVIDGAIATLLARCPEARETPPATPPVTSSPRTKPRHEPAHPPQAGATV